MLLLPQNIKPVPPTQLITLTIEVSSYAVDVNVEFFGKMLINCRDFALIRMGFKLFLLKGVFQHQTAGFFEKRIMINVFLNFTSLRNFLKVPHTELKHLFGLHFCKMTIFALENVRFIELLPNKRVKVRVVSSLFQPYQQQNIGKCSEIGFLGASNK